MKYSIKEIIAIINPVRTKGNALDGSVNHLLIDSRKLLFPESSLFFAFLGKQTDGHLFIPELYQKGLRAFIVEDPKFNPNPYPDASFLYVGSSMKALQQIASVHRQKFDIPVIGITGSNGKTIIKEWIFQLLGKSTQIVRSPGSYNSQIGVPLSVWQINDDSRLALIEAGVSRKNEMGKLAKIIQATIGIFTNLGDAHSTGFDTREEKLEEKLHLFSYAETIICCGDDEWVYTRIIQKFKYKNIVSWSFHDRSVSFYIADTRSENGNTRISYRWKDKESGVTIPFKDPVSIRLAIFSILSALVLGAKQKTVNQNAAALSAINMRLETKEGINNCMLINDSYNADLTSFTQALHFLSLQNPDRKKTLILSDFYQIAKPPEELNKKIATLIDKHAISRLILVGQNVKNIPRHLNKSIAIEFFETTKQLIGQIKKLHFNKEIILLKGARVFRFEDIFKKLSKRFHSTSLEINLDAISQNVLVYASFLKKETKIMAVIKASGYGAGSVKLALHLEKNNVSYFSVAFLDEGIELRKGGVHKPIMVFNSDLGFLDEMIDHRLEPVIYSFEQLKQFESFGSNGLGVHIKLDTGLNRLGFQEYEIDRLCDHLKGLPGIRILSVFSHLSASPTDEFDAFTRQQAGRFEQAYQKIVVQLGYKPLQHLLNSAGVVKFPEYQYDMVRIGSGIHGVDTSDRISNSLSVVHSLKAKINLIKKVKAGNSVGYERKGIIDRERMIAIIPIGYADGLVRKAGNQRYKVWINGNFAPIIGNVNMDLTMIDITDLDNVETGDEVEIFGPNASILELAKAGDTIFYEILSRISPRVKRIYVES